MKERVRRRILAAAGAQRWGEVQLIQPLWNGYGTLSRVSLHGGERDAVIVKHIQPRGTDHHPRGFGGAASSARKARSYDVEFQWYKRSNQHALLGAPTARCLDAFSDNGERFLVLEDLAERGLGRVLTHAAWSDVVAGLTWLARFHAHHLGDAGEGLWSEGSYWHLATRQDELRVIDGTRLHAFAGLFDARLRCGMYPTLIHGDAKLANFLYSDDRMQVAAVDFQYVGCGAAVKDISYFVGSAMPAGQCEEREEDVLRVYFEVLTAHLPEDMDGAALEQEWRSLYPVAWADFERFMAGWSPGHYKRSGYSDRVTGRAVDAICHELLGAARQACLAAGALIQARSGGRLTVSSKGLGTPASDVVTEVDIAAQTVIRESLEPTMARYELGWLAEEEEPDDSRLQSHAFWAVDPLDGTQHFVEGKAGYTTSIALVDRAGKPLLGVVYDPVAGELYEAVIGGGVTCNGEALKPPPSRAGPLQWYADRSLRLEPNFDALDEANAIHFVGGAVFNGLQVLRGANSVYLKPPKRGRRGCAIWDLAAVGLMVREQGGHVLNWAGDSLNLNPPERITFGEEGLAIIGPGVDVAAALAAGRGEPAAR